MIKRYLSTTFIAVLLSFTPSGQITGGGGVGSTVLVSPGAPGSLLTVSQVDAYFMTPTAAEVLANHPEITPTGAATTDLSYDTDVVVIMHGGSWAFSAEILAGDLTGMTEPTWANANDPGETVVDGDVTWTNVGLWSAFPPTPTAWQALHDYTPTLAVRIIYPATNQTATGHLYISFPVALTSGASQPNFSSVDFGEFISDGDGYWMDMGAKAGGPDTIPAVRTTAWGPTQCTSVTGVCDEATAGVFTIAAGSTTRDVATTRVGANSLIFLTFDESLGTRLGVTCNTVAGVLAVSTRTAGTSFRAIVPAGSTITNPACISYFIINPGS